MDAHRRTTTDNWLDDPYPSRAFQRVREFAPSARVANDSGEVAELPLDLRELGSVELAAVDGRPARRQRRAARGLRRVEGEIVAVQEFAGYWEYLL